MPYIIPHTFKAGEKAIAEQVNTNFNYVKQSLEQLNNTLGNKIDTTESTINTKIESLETTTQEIGGKIEDRDTIVKLGTIVPPDPQEDGQVPTADISLSADRIHTAAILANSQLVMPSVDVEDKVVNIMFEFTIGSEHTVALPLNIKWVGADAPEIIADGVTINRFYFDTTTNAANWCGYFTFHNTINLEG